ncbi:hypothetical protein KCU88_g2664, partial [Aureobasidium melanogenum]
MPAHAPSGSLAVYTQAESRRWNDSPFSPPDATRCAKYSSTSAPVAMSTVDVSENGLPVSSVSIRASSSLRDRRIDAAFSRIRDRSAAGVLAHDLNARFAARTDCSTSLADDVWIVHTGFDVEGSMD